MVAARSARESAVESTTKLGGPERDAAERRMLSYLMVLVREDPTGATLMTALDRIERSQIHRLEHGITLDAIGVLLASGDAITIDRLEANLAQRGVLDEMRGILHRDDAGPFEMAEFERALDEIPPWLPEPGEWVICNPRTLDWMKRKRRALARRRRAKKRSLQRLRLCSSSAAREARMGNGIIDER